MLHELLYFTIMLFYFMKMSRSVNRHNRVSRLTGSTVKASRNSGLFVDRDPRVLTPFEEGLLGAVIFKPVPLLEQIELCQE